MVIEANVVLPEANDAHDGFSCAVVSKIRIQVDLAFAEKSPVTLTLVPAAMMSAKVTATPASVKVVFTVLSRLPILARSTVGAAGVAVVLNFLKACSTDAV